MKRYRRKRLTRYVNAKVPEQQMSNLLRDEIRSTIPRLKENDIMPIEIFYNSNYPDWEAEVKGLVLAEISFWVEVDF